MHVEILQWDLVNVETISQSDVKITWFGCRASINGSYWNLSKWQNYYLRLHFDRVTGNGAMCPDKPAGSENKEENSAGSGSFMLYPSIPVPTRSDHLSLCSLKTSVRLKLGLKIKISILETLRMWEAVPEKSLPTELARVGLDPYGSFPSWDILGFCSVKFLSLCQRSVREAWKMKQRRVFPL